ncbi:MAG: monovalent cation/H+ antiporter subunit D family protein [Zoogloeaceae bacterium]|nr:monovalent cation/H+ antiporter subunit D family protein [Zoogloeaceae bacterium]
MNGFDTWLPQLVLATSLVAAVVIFGLDEEHHRTRSAINLTAAVLKLTLVAWMAAGVLQQTPYEFRFTVVHGADFVLRADALGMMFAGLSSLLWLFTTIYAIGYLEGSPNRSRFFGFFSLCVASTVGIALAGNLFTFVLFYEFLTLSTYPLVVHRGTPRAMAAGRLYLAYTLGGGIVLLLGTAALYMLAGEVEFAGGAALRGVDVADGPLLTAVFAALIAGLGVKSALLPLHGWLPTAMVAPAPVSALLHAVAVVKAGAFGIVRVVYDVFGIEFAAQLGVLTPLAVLAAATILYGSLRALQQTDIKRRLAFSTVSQVSYIVLGVTLFGPIGTAGGLVHLLHQGLMKITLFFCAGNYAETLGIHRIDQLDGVGRRMPATSAAFTVGALGMIGIPPTAGFISKWYLGIGAIDAGMPWALAVLVASSVLNAAYFLPVLYRIWFAPAGAGWPQSNFAGWRDTHPALLVPALATALFSLAAGLLAAAAYSPLYWAEVVVGREYLP